MWDPLLNKSFFIFTVFEKQNSPSGKGVPVSLPHRWQVIRYAYNCGDNFYEIVPKSNMSLSVTRKRNVVLSVDIIVNLILAQDCLVQMQEGSDPNLRPEATWFMKIGECR